MIVSQYLLEEIFMAESGITFREALKGGAYKQAVDILLQSEDRSTRGYTMARAALGFSTESNCWGIEIKEAMTELLEAHNAGYLQPPLSDELVARLGTFVEAKQVGNWAPFQGVGSLLLAQVETHYQQTLSKV
jgi:hypothetical protein